MITTGRPLFTSTVCAMPTNQEWATTRQFRFVFIGVMKQSPYRLFAVDATSIPGFMDYGRKKYRFWLRKWREEQNNRNPSAPAWSMSA